MDLNMTSVIRTLNCPWRWAFWYPGVHLENLSASYNLPRPNQDAPWHLGLYRPRSRNWVIALKVHPETVGEFDPCTLLRWPFKEHSEKYKLCNFLRQIEVHSSKIKGLRSTKCSSEMLQNLLNFMHKKPHVVL